MDSCMYTKCVRKVTCLEYETLSILLVYYLLANTYYVRVSKIQLEGHTS